jgi:hypothetical protein
MDIPRTEAPTLRAAAEPTVAATDLANVEADDPRGAHELVAHAHELSI